MNYSTHVPRCGAGASRNRVLVSPRRLKQQLGAVVFWTSQMPWVRRLMPGTGRLDIRIRRTGYRIRHLPAPEKGATLLDVGCGNGSFLGDASRMGYRAVGVDNDPEAVRAGRSRGLDVRLASMPGSGLSPGIFDHITLDNVLEHLHRPKEALQEIVSLLKPGGRAWVSQPNLDAIGLQVFGGFWRGLEAPRHLTLWGFESLRALMQESGLVNVSLIETNPHALRSLFARSERQRRGLVPDVSDEELDRQTWDAETETRFREAAASLDRGDWSRGESLTVVAYKPGPSA